MERVPVRVRDCACPDTPHEAEGDLVYLAAIPPLAMVLACQVVLNEARSAGRSTVDFMLEEVRYGFVGTNWDPDLAVEDLMADGVLAAPVAAKAQELYTEAVMAPLGMSPRPNRATRRSSQRGQTTGSTSRTRRSRSRPAA